MASIRIPIWILWIASITGCTTYSYTSPRSKLDVSECIAKGWEKVPASGYELTAFITDFTEYYFVAIEFPSIPSDGKHSEYDVWSEIRDSDSGSKTEYHRAFQIFHERLDQVVMDCQKQVSTTSAIPFITWDSDTYASVEGTFIRKGTANWDDLYVKAVDEHLLITKPVEGRRSSLVARVSGGEHEITVGFSYSHNGWPRNGSVKILANLSVGKSYKLNSRQEESDYHIELYDKGTGEVVSRSGNQKGLPVPPPPGFMPPPSFMQFK